jgi:streptogramin lyase
MKEAVLVAGARTPVGRGPGGLAVGPDAAWVTDTPRDRVLRVDATSGDVIPIAVGDRPSAVAADRSAVWVINTGDRTLTRIDPATRRVEGAPVSLGKELQDVALQGGDAWVAAADATVTRLDATTGRVRGAPIAVDAAPLALASDARGVWVASTGDRTIRHVTASS